MKPLKHLPQLTIALLILAGCLGAQPSTTTPPSPPPAPATLATTVSTSAALDTALRTATPGAVILLNPGVYTLTQHIGSLRFGSNPITIQSADLGNPAIIDCARNCYISGAQGVILRHLSIPGRMNWDAWAAPHHSGNLTLDHIAFTDASGWGEMLKLTHLDNVLITGSTFIRSGTGSWDRPVDAVGVDNLIVEHSYFERCYGGCIQIKGGSREPIVRHNLLNVGGGRGIQIGGSTCPGCWEPNEDGTPGLPAPDGFEAFNGLVHDNIIIGTNMCLSASTQTGAYFHHNTCYWPRSHTIPNNNGTFGGGQYLFYLAQEVDPNMSPNTLRLNQNIRMESNLFMYPIRTLDDRAGFNSQITNWTAGKDGKPEPQDFQTFTFDHNAIYAISPIVDAGFGNRTPPLYPHRHPVTGSPWNPFPQWKDGMLDQVYPGVADWGLGSMRALGTGYGDIGARVSRRAPAGVPGMVVGNPAPEPTRPEQYPVGTAFYGWEWPGWDGPIPEDGEVDPPPPPPAPDVMLYILRLVNGDVLLFDTHEEAQGWLDGATIEGVTRAPALVGVDAPQ